VFLETPHGGGQVCQDQATRGRLTGVASAMSSVREASSEGVASGTVSQRYLPQLQVSLAGGRQGSWSGAPPSPPSRVLVCSSPSYPSRPPAAVDWSPQSVVSRTLSG
jgi:hypothetical protein